MINNNGGQHTVLDWITRITPITYLVCGVEFVGGPSICAVVYAPPCDSARRRAVPCPARTLPAGAAPT